MVVAASVGLAHADAPTVSAEALLRDADTAMYRAKAEGRRRWVVFDPTMTRQLRDDRIVRTVRRELAATGLPACALSLEITESVLLDDSEVTQRVLMELRGLGVRLVVDDVGTGYSALGYLRRHPVTGVKIDRSFVDGLGRDAEDEEIVRAVVAMASALGLSVVAEGVELEAQRQVLQSFGVQHGQGHLWGRAVDAVAFAVSPATMQTRLANEIMAAPPTRG